MDHNNESRDTVSPLDAAFSNEVFPQELEALRSRAAAASRSTSSPQGLPDFDAHLSFGGSDTQSAFLARTRALLDDPKQEELWQRWAAEQPEKRHAGLTGLALSGGGIRSSTINLGIVQALDRIGLFECFDYLSTVSGGGYVGSSISACYSDPAPAAGDRDDKPAAARPPASSEDLAAARDRFPFRHTPGKPEPATFLQLRNFSSFLVPKGFIDYMKLPVLLLRGLILNFLVILPWITGAALVSYWLSTRGPSEDGGPGPVRWLWADRFSWPVDFQWFEPTLWLVTLFVLLATVFPVVRICEKIFGQGDLRTIRGQYESLMVGVLLVTALVAWVDLQPVVLNVLDDGSLLRNLTAGIGILSAAAAAFGNMLLKFIRSIFGRAGLYLIALAGFVAFWLLYLMLWRWMLDDPEAWPYMAAIVLTLAIYTNLFVDANGLSMHNFYRDRLAKAFLFRAGRDSRKVDSAEALQLSATSPRLAPLHIVNTTLNTKDFPERFRKGRHAEPFFMTSLATGSRITGYCSTAALEKMQPDLTMSTAIATSGAAMSSNMGVYTTPALRVILSVLNIRLGYWLLHPHAVDPRYANWKRRIGRWLGVGVLRYLQELTGHLSYKNTYVYLSDGGHIENLGLYELVRRQCRFIVVGDGEGDPEYTFNGLLEAMRLIQVDFGFSIEMDGLDEIRAGEQQHARGTIYYPGGRIGYFIYLKSSLLGDDMIQATVSHDAYVSSPLRRDLRHYDELGYIAHYKATHPEFPQETTADQFFDETQFECYRALGYLIAKRALIAAR